MIPVTKTFFPPHEQYTALTEKIWQSGWLTNNGKLVVELEQQLCRYLGVKHVVLVSNGTLALQLAIRALDLQGEILTTPFSYVATAASIVWEGCTPVFVDIDPDTLCIDPNLVEQAITPNTRAILATHVYGGPCAVEQIAQIAAKHNLKAIYDGAHAFGVTYKNESVLKYGDLTTLSFHATKLFHTGEGGAVVTNDDDLAAKLNWLRNFGHADEHSFYGLGINAKISELHAAMGLCVLPFVDGLIQSRKEICLTYDRLLLPSGIKRPALLSGTGYTYSYYPILLQSEAQLFSVYNALAASQIFPRRYFYPSLTELPYVDSNPLPVVNDLAKRVLCLPLYHDLPLKEVERIASIVTSNL